MTDSQRDPFDDERDMEVAEMIAAAELRTALRRFMRVSEGISRRAGLTPQRYLLLLLIGGAADGSGRATVTELMDGLQLAQSTVTELVQRAEEAGLVEREPMNPQTRSVKLRLTSEGRRRLRQAFGELAAERRLLSETVRSLGL